EPPARDRSAGTIGRVFPVPYEGRNLCFRYRLSDVPQGLFQRCAFLVKRLAHDSSPCCRNYRTSLLRRIWHRQSSARSGKRCLEQDTAAGGAIVRPGVLDLVVADAVSAIDELSRRYINCCRLSVRPAAVFLILNRGGLMR